MDKESLSGRNAGTEKWLLCGGAALVLTSVAFGLIRRTVEPRPTSTASEQTNQLQAAPSHPFALEPSGALTSQPDPSAISIAGSTEPGKEQFKAEDKSPSSERLLTHADLQGKSARELSLMRNEFYARHGYIFKAQELTNYFRAQKWYRGNERSQHAVHAKMSEVEQQNVAFISRFQESNSLTYTPR
jgi:hypothetical protein